ncbi:MAG TPA: ABC transporter permease [Burkholderiales bacterium]|nr:ABC transporter permease [Burkholderiales bacterium]
MAERPAPLERPELVHAHIGRASTADVARSLSLAEQLANIDPVRKFTVLLGAIVVWELYTRLAEVPPLIFPTFQDTVVALWKGFTQYGLGGQIWTSISILLAGYAIGLAIGAALSFIAVSSRFGSDVLGTLTAMLNPLPAVALLPLAMIWFGLGEKSLVFVLLHSIVWPVALNTHTGFMSVPEPLRMVGRNYGLRNVRYVAKLLVPAAFPSILAGLKLGWAFAWRTLIAAELIFGAAAEGGGLGWFIFASRNEMDIPGAFAGLLTVILIGFLVENVIFRNIESRTVVRWGMQT